MAKRYRHSHYPRRFPDGSLIVRHRSGLQAGDLMRLPDGRDGEICAYVERTDTNAFVLPRTGVRRVVVVPLSDGSATAEGAPGKP